VLAIFNPDSLRLRALLRADWRSGR